MEFSNSSSSARLLVLKFSSGFSSIASRHAEILCKKRVCNRVPPVVEFDMSVLHKLGLGEIDRRGDAERVATAVSVAEFVRPLAGKCDKQLLLGGGQREHQLFVLVAVET